MKSRQLWLSPIGILASCCLFALVVIIALKLTTHYMEYFSIKGIYERIIEDPKFQGDDVLPEDILNTISSRLTISSIRDSNVIEESYAGQDEDGSLLLEFDYEVREHILGNVDVVLSFSYSSAGELVVLGQNEDGEEE